MRRKEKSALRAVSATLVATSLAGCRDHGFLAASGPVAAARRDHFISIVPWMMIMIVPVFFRPADHVDAKRKAGTKAHYEDVPNRLVLPEIGKLKAKDLTRADLAQLHLGNKGTPFQANPILAIVGSMHGFGAKHGPVPEDMNPARGIERYKEDGRERYLSIEELERLRCYSRN